MLLPTVTRVQPRIAGLAALGCVGLMAVSHVQRGQAASTPFNFLLAALAAFVAWGRLPRA